MSRTKSPKLHSLRIVRAGQPVPRSAFAERPDIARVERALAGMATRISQARTLSESDRLQLSAVHSLTRARSSFICRLDMMGKRLDVSCARGRNDAAVRASAIGEGPAGQAFSQSRIVRAGDRLAVPLIGPEGPVGALVLISVRPALSDDLLKVLAAHIVAAAEVARLRDESARRQKDLQTAVAGLKGLEKHRDELMAQVSHDLKNPLSAIKTALALLERGNSGKLGERAQRAVEISQRNADRLLRMINDLLLITQLERGEIQLDERPFGLKGLVEEAVSALDPLAQDAAVSVVLRRGAEVFVQGSRARLLEALFSVLENAVQRSPQGASVELAVSVDSSRVAKLSIEDRSVGFAPDELESAFDSFYRPGIGQRMRRVSAELGLPTAGRVIRVHGGRVASRARSGGGLGLDIYLPTFAAAVTANPRSLDAAPGAVLLVEDDKDCRDVLHQILVEENYPVVAAATCAEALAWLNRLRPGLVLLDLRLSDGDGLSILERIRSTPRLAKVPVYIISGASDAAEITARFGARVDGLLEKPLHLAKLLDVVASAVRPLPSAAS